MRAKQNSPFALIIFGIIFIVGGWLLYVHVGVPLAEEAKASETWPAIQGEITYSDIRESESDGTTMYSAEINYYFTVENKSYSGNRISLTSGNSSTSSLREVKKDLQKYPVGADVTIYYDPELPNNAVLEPGADLFTYLIKYGPLFMCLIGALMLLKIIKKIGLLILALFIGSRK